MNPSTTPSEPTRKPPTLPVRFRRTKRAIRGIEHVVLVGTVASFVFLASPGPDWIYDQMDREERLTPADAIICLGGEPGRIIEAARLLREGLAPRLIVSSHGSDAYAMRDMAADWGADFDRIVVDDQATRTADHPATVARAAELDRAHDKIIIVTSHLHLARSKAVFEKAGYRHIVMREPRWERRVPVDPSWTLDIRARFIMGPKLAYEGAAWIEYWIRGYV